MDVEDRYVFRLFLWQYARMDKAEYDTLPEESKTELILVFIGSKWNY
jgi:hypothetical protein